MKRPIVIGSVVVLLVGIGALAWNHETAGLNAEVQPMVLDAGDLDLVALGQGVYQEHCASCHGEALEGEPQWRTRKRDGRLPAPPHDASGHTWHHTDDVLFQLTKYGPEDLVGGDYRSNMPAYDRVLSDREIIGALAYIKSTWPKGIRARHDAMNAANARRMQQRNRPE